MPSLIHNVRACLQNLHTEKPVPSALQFFRHFKCSKGNFASAGMVSKAVSGWWLSHPSEKYESQWEGLSHILWKIIHSCLKPPTRFAIHRSIDNPFSLHVLQGWYGSPAREDGLAF